MIATRGDINTVTGQPHGNMPYADYSVFAWLRKEIRHRLKQSGPDPVGAAIDLQSDCSRLLLNINIPCGAFLCGIHSVPPAVSIS